MGLKKQEIQIKVTPEDDKNERTPRSPVKSKSRLKKERQDNKMRLLFMIFLSFGFFLVELIVGYLTHSVSLVADSFHMLSDVMSLIIGFIAIRIAPKKWSQNTFGWARAEVLGALINAVFLAALCLTIVMQSLERFIEIQDITEPKLVLIVGVVGLVVNLIGLGLFHKHGHSHGGGGGHGHGHSHGGGNHNHSHDSTLHSVHLEADNKKRQSEDGHVDLVNWTVLPVGTEEKAAEGKDASDGSSEVKPPSGAHMNMHGVFLHVLADALGSVVVIISALIIWLTEWKYRMYIDPFLSLLMVCLILASVWPLLVESSKILLQTVPTHIQIDALKNKLLSEVKGTREIHEFHIWQLSGNRIIASAHILCSNQAEFMRISEQVKEFFHREGIHSTTIQLEFGDDNEEENMDNGDPSDDITADDISDTRSDCILTCPFDDEDADCVSNSCCGVVQRRKNANANSPVDNSTSTRLRVPTTSGSVNPGYAPDNVSSHECGSRGHGHVH